MNIILHSEEAGAENEETKPELEFTKKDEIKFILYGIFVFIMSYPVGKLFIKEERHPLLELAFGVGGVKVFTAIGRFVMGYICISFAFLGVSLIALLIEFIKEKRRDANAKKIKNQ